MMHAEELGEGQERMELQSVKLVALQCPFHEQPYLMQQINIGALTSNGAKSCPDGIHDGDTATSQWDDC